MTGGKIVYCSVLQLHLQVTQTSANPSAGTRFHANWYLQKGYTMLKPSEIGLDLYPQRGAPISALCREAWVYLELLYIEQLAA